MAFGLLIIGILTVIVGTFSPKGKSDILLFIGTICAMFGLIMVLAQISTPIK